MGFSGYPSIDFQIRRRRSNERGEFGDFAGAARQIAVFRSLLDGAAQTADVGEAVHEQSLVGPFSITQAISLGLGVLVSVGRKAALKTVVV
jgi:hypothetical protein